MKKLLLSFLSLFLIAGMALAEDSYTVTFKSANGGDSSSEIGTVVSSIISEGVEYIKSIKEHSKVYLGKSNYGLKFGTGSVIGKLELGISPGEDINENNGQVKATKIVVSASKYGNDTGKLKVLVNGTELGQITPVEAISEFTFDVNLTEDQVLETIRFETTAKRCYVQSFTVYYEDGNVDTREDVTLSFPEAEYTAMLGEAFEAPVLSGAPEGAEIVYTSSDEAVATVAATGAVTLVGEGTTTITASFDGNDNYKPAKSVEYTLTVIDPNAPIVLWKLVTDINDLDEGDIVTIACNSKGAVMTNSSQGNYREQKDATFYSNKKFIADDAAIMQLELGKSGDNWTFKTLNYEDTNGYIGNSDSKNNYCTISSTDATGFTAAVTISTDGNASIKFSSSTRNILKYNASSPRFTCYSSGQTDVQIYKLIKVAQPIAAPTVEVALNEVELVSEYGFDIMYAVTSDENAPVDFEESSEAIVLKELKPGMNYIWAKTVVGPYESEAECIHVYENIDTDEVKEVACTYTHDGMTPGNNCWVVIGAEVNGKHYFMGPDGKAIAATVVENQLAGYASHFNNTVNEYRHVDGNLTIKDAAAKVAARAAVSDGLTLAVANDGVATVTTAEGTLGFDAEKKAFSADADNKALKVFATSGDVNTGVDNVAVDNENVPAEYYNLQGVRVENPAKGGLYIKRQGATVTKIAL